MEQTIPIESSAGKIPFKRRIFYISIIYFGFLLLLLAIEGGARLTLPHVSSLELFVNTPQQRAQVANPQQVGIFEGDPLLLWRLKPNLAKVEWDFTLVSTNGQNLRAAYEVKAKAHDTIRIVCLGDSVTFGYRVPPVWPERPSDYDPEWIPYPMLLEKQLRAANPGRKIEVVAMAVPGYTSHQGLAWLRRDIDNLQPDLLTVSFGWNDASFSDAADRETIKTDWRAVFVRWTIDHSQAFAHASKWLRARNQAPMPVRTPVPRVSEQEYVNNMREIVRLAQDHGAKVIVIGAPYRDRVTNPPEANLMIGYRSALRSAMRLDQIPYVEIRELTEAGYPANEGWFGELIHPNHMGHRLMTAELLKLFESSGVIPGLTIPKFTP
ncbi:MAG: SGNH/GDSL hydrolase family protein [Pyrinomonadaceae bacterium]